MIKELSSLAVQSFIREHEFDDVGELLLKLTSVHNVPMSLIAVQITGRKKAKEKLPLFYNTPFIIYSEGLNLEQCSSEQTAQFKSTIVSEIVERKETCLDLTGGFGVDSLFFSKVFRLVHYIEPNKRLYEITRHNHQQLQAAGIAHHNITAEEFLKSTTQFFDFIYIDPSRRGSGNRKVFSFAECEPDVTTLLPVIFRKTNQLLIKASPLLDLQQGIRGLFYVKDIFVVAVENECKEVLFYCEKNFEGEPSIHAIDLSKGKVINKFTFTTSDERSITSEYSQPLTYLYEPNAAILKAGAFKMVGIRYTVKKLHHHTHLYTSEMLDRNFPGRIFRIIAHVKPSSKTLRDYFPQGKANVTTRNYPMTVKELRVKTRLKDGGDSFLIGFTGVDKKYLVVAEKIS